MLLLYPGELYRLLGASSLQKRSSAHKECDTFQTHYALWSTVRLLVL